MTRPRLLHLFNAFEVGGVERQHMMLVERLARDFDQACWSFHHGPIMDELDALCIPHRHGGIDVANTMLMEGCFDCVVTRTNRYLDATREILARHGLPVVYMKDYLRWMDGNRTYLDLERDAVAASMAWEAFYCGPSLAAGLATFANGHGAAGLMYNGLDLSRFPLTPRSAPPGPSLRVVMVANVVERKNQLLALEALHEELSVGRLTLTLAGGFQDARYTQRLRQAAMGLPVTLLGYVADPAPLLAEADVFLMTSTLEGWPVALMEAMASGLPVVAPAIGDIPRLIEDGAGLLYPCNDAIALARRMAEIRNPATYEDLSARAVSRVRQFDIDTCHRQLDVAVRRALTCRANVSPRKRNAHVLLQP